MKSEHETNIGKESALERKKNRVCATLLRVHIKRHTPVQIKDYS